MDNNSDSSKEFSTDELVEIESICDSIKYELDIRHDIADNYRNRIKAGDALECYNTLPKTQSKHIDLTSDNESLNQENISVKNISRSYIINNNDNNNNNISNLNNGIENTVNYSSTNRSSDNKNLTTDLISTNAEADSESLISKRRKVSDESSM